MLTFSIQVLRVGSFTLFLRSYLIKLHFLIINCVHLTGEHNNKVSDVTLPHYNVFLFSTNVKSVYTVTYIFNIYCIFLYKLKYVYMGS